MKFVTVKFIIYLLIYICICGFMIIVPGLFVQKARNV